MPPEEFNFRFGGKNLQIATQSAMKSRKFAFLCWMPFETLTVGLGAGMAPEAARQVLSHAPWWDGHASLGTGRKESNVTTETFSLWQRAG